MSWLRPIRHLPLAAGWLAAMGCAWAVDSAERQKELADVPAYRRAALLLQFSSEAEFTDPSQALELARRALAAAQSPADSIRARVRLAASERALGDYGAALADANESRTAALAEHDDRLRAQALLVIGRTQWGLSQLPESVATFRELLDLAVAQHDVSLEIDGRMGLGIALSEAGDKELGRQQFQLGLDLAQKAGDNARLGTALTNLGNHTLGDGDARGAKSFYERAKVAFDRAGNVWGSATSVINLGQVAEDAGDLRAALQDDQSARDTYRRLGLKRQWANAERQLGSVLSKLGRTRESQQAFEHGLGLARQLGSHTVLANLYHEQSLALERAGDIPGALRAQRKFGAEHEAALDEKSRRQIAELGARFDAEHREREIVALRAGQATHEASELQSRTRAYELAALLVIGVLIGTLIVGWQRITLLAQRRVAAEAELAREAAVQADRVKTRLLGIASHDLRGPLGNIHQIADELQREQGHQGVRDERLDWIKVESSRLTRLVQDLLDTAALDTGRLELRSTALDLAAVVEAAVTELHWQLQEKRQRIVYAEPPPGVGRVVGDVDRLRQLVGNILSNAVKFSPMDAAIMLTLSRRADRVVLTVADEGPGLTAQDRERIFTPFSRLSAQPTGREMSHGLGLSIAHEIVRLHGGTIGVESEPGKGAVFRIELPAA
jgi:signal transduction histidine kinase